MALYNVSCERTSASTGMHTLTAFARDTIGNRITSLPVMVNVANSAPQPPGTPGVRSPFRGAPMRVPGEFEAEDFDKGGEGVAYHDLTPGNQGGYYRLTEDVDIINPYPLGYVVTDFQRTEWLEYTINVTQAGTYRLEALVSSIDTSGRFHFEVDRKDVTGLIVVPNTGWWDLFRWVGRNGVSLTAGQHILRIYVDAEKFNLDKIALSLEGSGRDRVVHH